MDSFEKFNLNKPPKKEDFYDKLKLTSITDEQYQHVLNVWKKFKMKNMGLSRFVFKNRCFIIGRCF